MRRKLTETIVSAPDEASLTVTENALTGQALDEVDFDALTPAQQAAVHNVACCQEGVGCSQKVLRRLADKGFIAPRTKHIGGYPPMTVTVYEMPVHVHIRWAEWCSSLPDMDEVS